MRGNSYRFSPARAAFVQLTVAVARRHLRQKFGQLCPAPCLALWMDGQTSGGGGNLYFQPFLKIGLLGDGLWDPNPQAVSPFLYRRSQS
jgi:hypothetical protein